MLSYHSLFIFPCHPIQIGLRSAAVEEIISGMRLFSQCDKPFLRSVMQALVQQLHCSHSVLLNRCCPEGMYLIRNGSVQVTDLNARKQHMRHPGECFAEQALFPDQPSTPMEVSVANF